MTIIYATTETKIQANVESNTMMIKDNNIENANTNAKGGVTSVFGMNKKEFSRYVYSCGARCVNVNAVINITVSTLTLIIQ